MNQNFGNNKQNMSVSEKIEQDKVIKKIKDDKGLIGDFKRFPLLYLSLGVAGILTFFDAVWIAWTATAPVSNTIVRLLLVSGLGSLIGTGFVSFGEFATANWERKFFHREKDNKTQYFVSISMLVLSGIFSAVTAYASTNILAVIFGVFSEHLQIPDWAQNWLIGYVPLAIFANVISTFVYRNKSRSSEIRRQLSMIEMEKTADADERILKAEMNARASIAEHQALAFEQEMEERAKHIGRTMGVHRAKEASNGFDFPQQNETSEQEKVYPINTEDSKLKLNEIKEDSKRSPNFPNS